MPLTRPASILPPGVEVIPTEKLDLRAESEIVDTLLSHRPVTSEKNIWAFWDGGWNTMRPWTRRNAIAWMRRFEPLGWTVRLLDMVPQSANHISSFLRTDGFPEAFKSSPSRVPQAVSDLVRLSLLCEFGGCWLDVGCMVFCDLDDIWGGIQDPETPFTMAGYITNLRPNKYHLLNTSVLFSQRGDAFVRRWRDGFATLWQGRTSSKDIHEDPLVSWLGLYNAETLEDYEKDEESLKAFTDYLAVHLVFERLVLIQDPSDGFDGRAHWSNKVFKLDTARDQAYPQEATAYDGQRLYDLFASRREGLEPEARNQGAEALANYVCAHTTIVKLFSGVGARQAWLPALWNRPEHADADVREGSFGAWLRYAQVHLRPTRKVVPVVAAAMPDDDCVVRAGVCERNLKLVRRRM